MRFLFGFSFYFLLINSSFAQERTSLDIHFVIDDEEEQLFIGNINVINSNTDDTVRVNENGETKIQVNVGDVLYIESNFYEYRSLLVTQNMVEEKSAEVHLNVKIIELEQANLGFQLTGDLLADSKNAGYIDSIGMVYKNLGIKEKDIPKIQNKGHYIPKFKIKDALTLNIGKAIGELNGYNRRQRTLYDYEKDQTKMNIVRKEWRDDYFTDSLKIPRHKIQEFVLFVYGTTDIYFKVKNGYYLEAEEIWQEKSVQYLERLNSQNLTK